MTRRGRLLSSWSYFASVMLFWRQMRALIVEDEMKMAGLLRRGHEGEGLAVDVAPSGSEAFWLATENPTT